VRQDCEPLNKMTLFLPLHVKVSHISSVSALLLFFHFLSLSLYLYLSLSVWPVSVSSVVQKVTVGQVFSPVLFPLSESLHQCPAIIFVPLLRLPEVQTGEAWGPSTKTTCFRMSESI